ncbi:MAG TPA: isoaspartyl peptidase/L-asparaginase [Terriglobales bacterium]|nr:isoaspartyl peptidase/L-asparaginase [Terriglobales bacterium]
MGSNPVLVVHGGAWAIPDDMVEAHIKGVRSAMAAGWDVLARGGTSVEAIEAAVVAMEDDETFDAGRGSFLNSDGRVQLDAMVMEGQTLRAGGVGCVERIKNPVRAARLILEDSAHVYFVGQGAERFAEEHGLPLVDNSALVTEREIARLRNAKEQKQLHVPSEFTGDSALTSHDTVGAVALDIHGNIAAATSTGGTLNKAPGRVGDSSLIGCGCYADNDSAAVSTTGWGEAMMKLVLGKWACDRVRSGATPDQASEEALEYLKNRLGGHGGMILLDPHGNFGIAHNTPRMAWAMKSANQEQWGIEKNRAIG